MTGGADLERGRRAYAARSWLQAFAALSAADTSTPLGASDLELLAAAAYLSGRDDDGLGALERAHRTHLEAGERLAAVRCAFWLGIHLMIGGATGRGTGWLARAERLVGPGEQDCPERAYLASASAFRHLGAGRWEEARADAALAAELGARHGERDVVALALIDEGRALAALGRVEEGLARLDEAMVGVTAGELSPIVSGLVYCSVIEGCHDVYELRRAREWTDALTRWCDEQPDLVPFTGTCLLHRAELMQLQGGWRDALDEARRAGDRFEARPDRPAAARARYRQGEVLRLQGRLAEAEEAYREASRLGFEPQPGLALLRLAQGDRAAAAASIRTATAEPGDPSRRAALLPAYVEILLAAGDVDAAVEASRELASLAAGHESRWLGAVVAHAQGAVALAAGDGAGALVPLRHAADEWRALDVPYECARARVLTAVACRALGDDDTARLELDAARTVFAELGARLDLACADVLATGAGPGHGLTGRELEVLRLVAAGESNKAIAARLVLSERTVDRHLSNIFAKLHVSSRTAAAAYAFEHRLV
jgi:ATP/maltotriose-dependent transcriptional regulator MalT